MKKWILMFGVLILIGASFEKDWSNKRIKRAVSEIYALDTTLTSTDTIEIQPLEWDDGGYHSLWIMCNADTTWIYYQLSPFGPESTSVWNKTKKHLFQTITTDSADYYAFQNIPVSRYCKLTIIAKKASEIKLRVKIHLWQN